MSRKPFTYKITHKPLKKEDFATIKTLLALGTLKSTEIAKACGRSATTVGIIKRFDTYQEYRDYQNEITARKRAKQALATASDIQVKTIKYSVHDQEIKQQSTSDLPQGQIVALSEPPTLVEIKDFDKLIEAINKLTAAWESKPKGFFR